MNLINGFYIEFIKEIAMNSTSKIFSIDTDEEDEIVISVLDRVAYSDEGGIDHDGI